MSNRTPGPWTAKRLVSGSYPGFVILWPDTSNSGLHMRRLDSFSGSFSEGDANLIAAAPELLAHLEKIVTLFDMHDDCKNLPQTTECRNKARSLIAKAQGNPYA